MGERLVYGGTIQIQKGPPLALDLSPQLGYRFNKRITSGVGITYRLSLSGDSWAELRRSIATTDAVYGGRAYVEYEVVKSFFVHGEYERLSQAVPVNNQDLTARSWQVLAKPTALPDSCKAAYCSFTTSDTSNRAFIAAPGYFGSAFNGQVLNEPI